MQQASHVRGDPSGLIFVLLSTGHEHPDACRALSGSTWTCLSGRCALWLVVLPLPRNGHPHHIARTRAVRLHPQSYPCARREWRGQPYRTPDHGTYFLCDPKRHRTSKPGRRGVGCLVMTGTTGRTSCGTPERLRPSFPLHRYATARSAAQTILHLPQWSRASVHQALGVRGYSGHMGTGAACRHAAALSTFVLTEFRLACTTSVSYTLHLSHHCEAVVGDSFTFVEETWHRDFDIDLAG